MAKTQQGTGSLVSYKQTIQQFLTRTSFVLREVPICPFLISTLAFLRGPQIWEDIHQIRSPQCLEST
jgi:hypothetical protein